MSVVEVGELVGWRPVDPTEWDTPTGRAILDAVDGSGGSVRLTSGEIMVILQRQRGTVDTLLARGTIDRDPRSVIHYRDSRRERV